MEERERAREREREMERERERERARVNAVKRNLLISSTTERVCTSSSAYEGIGAPSSQLIGPINITDE